MKKDYYKVLGVPKSANEEEIKSVFRKLSLLYHPDRQVGKSEREKAEAEERFKEIAEAYGVLSDKEKRREYDMYGTSEGRGFNFNARDIFDRFAKASGFSFFENGFGHAANYHTAQKKGKAIKLSVDVTLEELYEGGMKTISYERYEPCSVCHGTGLGRGGEKITCPYCGGTGMIMETTRNGFTVIQRSSTCPHCGGEGQVISKPCPQCNGTGLERRVVSKAAEISPYSLHIVIPGGGNFPERAEGDVGDLIISLNILEHERFEIVEGTSNLATLCEVPILDCITGAKKRIVGIDGKEYSFRVNAGTTDGQTCTIKGLGMPNRYGGNGDLVIFIKQIMPEKLTEKELQIIDKLKNSGSFK